MKKKKMATINPAEQSILESAERGEWEPVKNMAQEIQRYQSYAQTQQIETMSVTTQAESGKRSFSKKQINF